MLTAKSEVDDKVLGLDAGADDYLTKPFQMKELLARIRSLGRRKDLDYQEDQLTFGNVVLARNELQLATTTNQVVLSPKEMKLMELFLSRPKVILSKETIINKIWGFDPDVEENRVEIYVSLLRKTDAARSGYRHSYDPQCRVYFAEQGAAMLKNYGIKCCGSIWC